MPEFVTSQADHLPQILALQRANLETANPGHPDGFVTVQHTVELLADMHEAAPHIVAVEQDEVVGYALSMTTEFAERIPVLAPMFAQFDTTEIDGRPLGDLRYLVMGQVCVAWNWRGQGVFEGLYRKQATTFEKRFEWIVTEISRRNHRSLAAHRKVGFRDLRSYPAKSDVWHIVALSTSALST